MSLLSVEPCVWCGNDVMLPGSSWRTTDDGQVACGDKCETAWSTGCSPKAVHAALARVDKLETAIQRIRIVSSNTNPMKPELVCLSGEEIDRLCRVALHPDALASPSSEPAPRAACECGGEHDATGRGDCCWVNGRGGTVERHTPCCPRAPRAATEPARCPGCGTVLAVDARGFTFCPKCHGPAKEPARCPRCGGREYVMEATDGKPDPCPACGTGREGEVAAMTFAFKERRIRLDIPMPNDERQVRQRWRVALLVIKAKLEAVAGGISTLEQEFLANIVTDSGMTVGQVILPRLSEATKSGRLLPPAQEAR